MLNAHNKKQGTRKSAKLEAIKYFEYGNGYFVFTGWEKKQIPKNISRQRGGGKPESNTSECSEPGIALCLEQGFAKTHRADIRPLLWVMVHNLVGSLYNQRVSEIANPQIPDPPLEVLRAHTPEGSSGSEKNYYCHKNWWWWISSEKKSKAFETREELLGLHFFISSKFLISSKNTNICGTFCGAVTWEKKIHGGHGFRGKKKSGFYSEMLTPIGLQPQSCVISHNRTNRQETQPIEISEISHTLEGDSAPIRKPRTSDHSPPRRIGDLVTTPSKSAMANAHKKMCVTALWNRHQLQSRSSQKLL